MFLVLFDYLVSPEAIDDLLPVHNAHLERFYDKGMFLASGPQDGQTGGVLLAEGTRQEVEAAVHADPFITTGAATVRIKRFHFFRTTDELASIRSDAAASWRRDDYRILDPAQPQGRTVSEEPT